MKNKKIQIAIDSPAASGAGTQAKLIAKYFNLVYLDTGKLYRILGKIYLKNNQKVNYSIFKKQIKTTKPNELNNKNLLNNNIGMAAAFLAKDKKIRKFVGEYQKMIANKPPKNSQGVCLDGRDITYNIMPNANVKFFMTASIKIRAKRRFSELKKLKHKITYKEIYQSIKERDKSDFNRKISPLKKTKDSILIDTSHISINKCFEKMKKIILNKIQTY
jgi:CMP/dCMP kinase